MYFFLFPQCVPSDSEVGYEKSIMTRTETFSITICFKEPLLFITDIDISKTSLKLRVYTSGNIFLLLAMAQQTLLIRCSVRVSVILRLHSDAI